VGEVVLFFGGGFRRFYAGGFEGRGGWGGFFCGGVVVVVGSDRVQPTAGRPIQGAPPRAAGKNRVNEGKSAMYDQKNGTEAKSR